ELLALIFQRFQYDSTLKFNLNQRKQLLFFYSLSLTPSLHAMPVIADNRTRVTHQSASPQAALRPFVFLPASCELPMASATPSSPASAAPSLQRTLKARHMSMIAIGGS